MARMDRLLLSFNADPAARGVVRMAGGVLHLLRLGALMVVLSLSPSSYLQPARRQAVMQQLVRATLPLLTWFLVLSALVSLVLIRIVVATAASYGLSQYAIEVLVRTLVLELIPLYAALFVALRHAMPQAQQVRALLARRRQLASAPDALAAVAMALFPRALASGFAVLLLAGLAGVTALVLSYLSIYGFSPWGLPAYTHAVGGIFSPAVGLIFALKTGLFALAVAVVPLAAAARPDAAGRFRRQSDMASFARLFSALLLIEIGSLLGNYA